MDCPAGPSQLSAFNAFGVEVDRAVGAAPSVGGDPADPAMGLQLCAVLDGRRPVGEVEGGFGSLGAPRFAGADSGAAGEGAHTLGCDRVRSGPPVPPSLFIPAAARRP